MTVRLLFVLRRRWPILIILPLLAAAVGFVFTPRGAAKQAVGYSSKALIAVDQGATSPTQVQQNLLEVQQGSIAAAAAKKLGGGITAAQVGERVTAAFDDTSFAVVLEVSGKDRADAEATATVIADTFVEEANGAPAQERAKLLLTATNARDQAKDDLDKFLDENDPLLRLPTPPSSVLAERAQLQSAYDAAQANLATVRASGSSTEIYRLINVQKGGIATASKLQLPASLALRVSLGFIFGLVGALILIALVEKLNPRIDDPDHAATLIGAPVLAMVPVMNRRWRQQIERADPAEFRGPFAEAFRSMRTHLDFRESAEPGDAPPRLMVTSATPGEGKSTTAAFLALSYAEIDRAPVVVGADLRRPSIHKFFDVARIPGLSSRVVAGESKVALGEIVRRDPITGVSVVASGPSVDRITGLLNDLSAVTKAATLAGRIVIVDTAPVMVANDAVEFLAAVDWVLLVVRVGRSTERSVIQMMKALNLNGAKVVGIVMLGSMESTDAKRYYYSYYSDSRAENRIPNSPSGSDEDDPPVVGSIDGAA